MDVQATFKAIATSPRGPCGAGRVLKSLSGERSARNNSLLRASRPPGSKVLLRLGLRGGEKRQKAAVPTTLLPPEQRRRVSVGNLAAQSSSCTRPGAFKDRRISTTGVYSLMGKEMRSCSTLASVWGWGQGVAGAALRGCLEEPHILKVPALQWRGHQASC